MIKFIVTKNTIPGRLAKALVKTEEDEFELVCVDNVSIYIIGKALGISYRHYPRTDYVINMDKITDDGNIIVRKKYVDKELRDALQKIRDERHNSI